MKDLVPAEVRAGRYANRLGFKECTGSRRTANARDPYCRFRFEETYDSVEDAKQRLIDLHRPSPNADDEYVHAMRTGFRVGAVTYVMQTDEVIFGTKFNVWQRLSLIQHTARN